MTVLNNTEFSSHNSTELHSEVKIESNSSIILVVAAFLVVCSVLLSMAIVAGILKNKISIRDNSSTNEANPKVIMVTPVEDVPAELAIRYPRGSLCTPPRPSPEMRKRQATLSDCTLDNVNLLYSDKNLHQLNSSLLRPPVYAVQFLHRSAAGVNAKHLPDVV